MVCSYIFVSEIMKMCKEKKVYENIEKITKKSLKEKLGAKYSS